MHKRILLLTTALAAVTGPAGAQELGFTLDTILLGSAFRDDRALLDTPVAVTVREGAALADRQAGTFEELIGDMPGVSIGGGPRGLSQEPNIRGFTDDQIVLPLRWRALQLRAGRNPRRPVLRRSGAGCSGWRSCAAAARRCSARGALGGVISVEDGRCRRPCWRPGQTHGRAGDAGLRDQRRRSERLEHRLRRLGRVGRAAVPRRSQRHRRPRVGDGAAVPFSEIDQGNGMIKLGFEPNADHRIELSYSIYPRRHAGAVELQRRPRQPQKPGGGS